MLRIRYISQSRLLQLPFRSTPLSGRSLFLSNRLSVNIPLSNHVRWLSQEIKIDDNRSTPEISQNEKQVFDMNSLQKTHLFFSQSSDPALLGTFRDLNHVVSLLEAAPMPERAQLLRRLAIDMTSSNTILDIKSQRLLFPFVESVFRAQPKPSVAMLADAASMQRQGYIQGLIRADKLSIYKPVLSEAIQATVASVGNRSHYEMDDDMAKASLDTLRLIHHTKGWYTSAPQDVKTLLQVAFHHSKENPTRMLEAIEVANEMKVTFATLPKGCEAAVLSMLLNPSISLPLMSKETIDSSATSQLELEDSSKPIIPIDHVSAVQFVQGLRSLKFELSTLPPQQQLEARTSLTKWYQSIFKSIIEDMQQQPLELAQKLSNTDKVVHTMASMASLFKYSSKNFITEDLMYEAMTLTLPTASSEQSLNMCLR